MISEPGTFDLADKVMLTTSMMKINKKIAILSPSDIGRLDKVAHYAAQALVDLVEVGKDWDGVLWYERLEETKGKSLAFSLLWLAAKEFGPGSYASNPFDEHGFKEINVVVKEWMAQNGIAMSDQEQWL